MQDMIINIMKQQIELLNIAHSGQCWEALSEKELSKGEKWKINE